MALVLKFRLNLSNLLGNGCLHCGYGLLELKTDIKRIIRNRLQSTYNSYNSIKAYPSEFMDNFISTDFDNVMFRKFVEIPRTVKNEFRKHIG